MKIQILKQQWNIVTRKNVCFDKKKEMPAKNSPHIYLSISEAETKAEVCKKSKNTKMYTVMSYFFAQQVSSLS